MFVGAARVYRRFRLESSFSRWQVVAAVDSQRHRTRDTAALVVQRASRTWIARRKGDHIRRTRGPAAVSASCTIQRVLRGHLARQSFQVQLAQRSKLRGDTDRRRRLEETRVGEARCKASITIQTYWRGMMGRGKGVVRGRKKLREILLQLGGGEGRMHRWVRRDVNTYYLANSKTQTN